MELQRKIRSIVNQTVIASQRHNSGANPTKAPQAHSHSNQGIAPVIVMIAVLTIIVLFCCLGAPGVRGLCKRFVFKTCVIDDPDIDNVHTRKCGYSVQDEVNEIKKLKRKMSQQAESKRSQQTETNRQQQ